jgi:D-alanyl-D-alanine carboxypeptidase/D-alanyl-D-alanine-endopeptidase (penicillin-binding protein 4)
MAAACLSAPAQTVVDATAKPSAVDQKPLPLDQYPLAQDQKPLALEQQIAALVAQPAVARAHWGIIVTTLDGRPIYALNEGQLFQPASNAKLFTTAAAMALLPPSHVFTTTVTGNGLFMEDGTLRGTLTLNGGGDANLSGRDLPYIPPTLRPTPAPPTNDPLRYLEEMADQVKASGVKQVEGDVTGSDALFDPQPYPSGWSLDDVAWGYGAPVSGLSVTDNTLQLTISPRRAGVPFTDALAMIEQAVPYYTVEMHATSTGEKKPTLIRIDRDPGSRVVRVFGFIAEGAQPYVEEIAIDDPAEYAAMAFKQMLIDRGVTVTGSAKTFHAIVAGRRAPTANFATTTSEPIADLGPVPESRVFPDLNSAGCSGCDKHWAYKVLAKHLSAPLQEDIVVTNKESLNLHAELLLLQLGLAVTGSGDRAQGVRVERQFLINAGIDKDDFVFYDGSGLSGKNLVTPRATAKLLSFAAHDPKTGAPQPWFADWKASLPVGGVDGTLSDRFTTAPLKGHVFAKTGSLGEARALSGYLDCASGQTVIFSILVDHHLPGDNADRDAMDKIVAAIAAAE